MTKGPLLTDDIIEEAQHRREELEANIRRGMQHDEELARKYDEKERQLIKQTTHKSRRIENAKTTARGKKLNLYLILSWVVLIAFIYYIIKWG